MTARKRAVVFSALDVIGLAAAVTGAVTTPAVLFTVLFALVAPYYAVSAWDDSRPLRRRQR